MLRVDIVTPTNTNTIGARRWSAELRWAEWPRVRIEYVEVHPCTGGRRVRAVVRLGALTPADVRVALAPEDVPCADDHRMWSSESYGNGSVVFERVLPSDVEVPAGTWKVCVHPADERAGRPVVYRLRLSDPDPSEG